MDVDLTIALDEANFSAALDVAEQLELVPAAPLALRDAAKPAPLEQWRRDENMFAVRTAPAKWYRPGG